MASVISFSNHTVAALRPQAGKVREIYGMSLGWEVWAQIELGLEMSHSIRSSGRAELEFGRFQREVMVYEGTTQRADFELETSIAHVRHLHFGELKCLIGRETTAGFAGRVRQDITKVKTARPATAWISQGPKQTLAVTGHVIAITVDPARNGLIDREMLQLAQTQQIRWAMAPVSADGIIKVWTWSKPLIAGGRRV